MSSSAHNADALTRALAEPSRRDILESLRFGPKSVTDLVEATGLKQPNVSNHLAKMRAQRLVRAERIGRNVFYSIALPTADFLLRLHEHTRNALEREEAESTIGSTIDPGTATELSFDVQRLASEAVVQPSRNSAWRTGYFQCLLTGNEDKAQALVHEMLARGTSLPVIYTEIFEWAMNRIGEQYEQGLTDEAHEHLATEMTVRSMARVAQFYTPIARSQRRAILGCVAGNWHAVGLRMLGDALRIQGWEILFLGANVPTPSFLAMIAGMHPDLVIVACTMQEQAPELQRLVALLNAAREAGAEPRFDIAVGGQYLHAHPELLHTLPVDFTASSLSEFLQIVTSRYPPLHRTA